MIDNAGDVTVTGVIYRRKKEKEREAEKVDDATQTSSPGDWRSRLSTFLHVHRGSRASSRKSSRASDASDLSELGSICLCCCSLVPPMCPRRTWT